MQNGREQERARHPQRCRLQGTQGVGAVVSGGAGGVGLGGVGHTEGQRVAARPACTSMFCAFESEIQL